jgi:hypothetical protein
VSERPIIIQQNQSQSQESCLGGGCSAIISVFVVLAILGALLEAMSGGYGSGWQIASIVGAFALLAFLLLAGIGWAGQRFGWFGDDSEPKAQDAADIIVEDELNYGTAENTSAGSATDEIEVKLQKLASLRERGFITADDYEEKKRELLDSM